MVANTPSEIRARIGDREVVVSVSGGKDSAAASLLMHDLGIPHLRIFCDTGWEHADTYRHLDEVLEPRLGPIVRLRAEVPILPGYEAEVAEMEEMLGRVSPMVRITLYKGCFPGQGTRWCTSTLKHEPVARFFEHRDDLVNVVGVRREESEGRKDALEWEWMPDVRVYEFNVVDGDFGRVGRLINLSHVEQCRPLAGFALGDVIDIHRRHNLALNPLYRLDFDRVGCFPCIFATKKDLAAIARLDPQRIAVLRLLERFVNERAQARRARCGKPAMRPPAWFQIRDALETERFRREDPELYAATVANGAVDGNTKHLCVPIDRAVRWAQTRRGGRQFELFGAPRRDWACGRFGFCEVRPTEGE